MREPLALRGFRSYWVAGTIGALGLSAMTVAVDVLVIDVLGASEGQVGLVRAAQFLPHLLLGLVAGAYVDRWRRRPTIVIASLAQSALLLAIPLLLLAAALSIPAIIGLLFAIGCCTVLISAAEKSYLPDLVPRRSLVLANARLGQSVTVAQTSGPALGGLLISVLSAPAALLVPVIGRVIGAVMLARIRRPEPAPHPQPPRLLRGIGEGLRFLYRHRTLTPLALSTHVWFVANSIAVTVLSLFVLRGLGWSAGAYGLVLASAGVGGLLGALAAHRAARSVGEGDVIISARILCALAWAATALTPNGAAPGVAVAYLCVVQLIYGFSMGIEEPSEMAYQQAAAPRSMLGRVNASMRSVNRSAAVIGALIGGILAGAVGFRPTFAIVAVVFAAAVALVLLSPLRNGRSGLEQDSQG